MSDSINKTVALWGFIGAVAAGMCLAGFVSQDETLVKLDATDAMSTTHDEGERPPETTLLSPRAAHSRVDAHPQAVDFSLRTRDSGNRYFGVHSFGDSLVRDDPRHEGQQSGRAAKSVPRKFLLERQQMLITTPGASVAPSTVYGPRPSEMIL